MFNVFAYMTRRPDTTREEFIDYSAVNLHKSDPKPRIWIKPRFRNYSREIGGHLRTAAKCGRAARVGR
jgi:hypothetical protein